MNCTGRNIPNKHCKHLAVSVQKDPLALEDIKGVYITPVELYVVSDDQINASKYKSLSDH